MSTDLQVFDFDEQAVRVIMRDGQPWFVAGDVCRVLNIANSRDAVLKLDADEKAGVGLTDTSSNGVTQGRTVTIINESGLYTLILRCDDAIKAGTVAHRFRKWVTGDVLPSLRKTGTYSVAPVLPAAPATEVVSLGEAVSLLEYVRVQCQDLTLDRQVAFARSVRSFASAVGVRLTTRPVPTGGKLIMVPRQVLDHVRAQYPVITSLPNGEMGEFEKLLEHIVHRFGSGQSHSPHMVRECAKALGLFPTIFRLDATEASQFSAFGKACERFNGCLFSNGISLRIDARRRWLLINREHEAPEVPALHV